jgi:hypothetical protein
MNHRVVFGLCVLVMGCDASNGTRDTLKSEASSIAVNAVWPNPSDPPCGACSYSANKLQVDVSLENTAQMPQMDLVLYTSTGEIVGKYTGLQPRMYARGKATYPVVNGASKNVAYGELGWQGLTGYHKTRITVTEKPKETIPLDPPVVLDTK